MATSVAPEHIEDFKMYAQINEIRINLSEEEKQKFRIKGPENSFIQISIIDKSENGTTCIDGFNFVFDSSIGEDSLIELIKEKANETLSAIPIKPKQIEEKRLFDRKIEL
jgi:hypothetical protein